MNSVSSESAALNGAFNPVVSTFPPLSHGGGAMRQIAALPIREILEMIKGGAYNDLVEAVRQAKKALIEAQKTTPDLPKSSLDKFERQWKATKANLPSFTTSGVFPNGAKDQESMIHSGLVQIDIDGIGEAKAASLRDSMIHDQHVFAAFLSPSGDGVKFLVKIQPDKMQHKLAFGHAMEYIEKRAGVKVDKSVGNINRLCFFSFDQDLKINETAVQFKGDVSGPAAAKGDAQAKTAVAPIGTACSKVEVGRALMMIPKRPDYGDWIEIANAVRAGIGREAALEFLPKWSEEETRGEYSEKCCELQRVSVRNLFERAMANGWRPEIYYDNLANRYYMLDADDGFRSYTTAHVRGLLGHYGLDKYQVEAFLADVRMSKCVDLVLNLSGLERGLHQIEQGKILVPVGPHRIKRHPGKWDTLRALWAGMLGEEQTEWFLHWLADSLKSFYSGRWQPAQVLAFIGPPASGKSLTQKLLTCLFGGREARVMQGITGETSFNGEWAEASHLVVEDEVAENNITVRSRVKEKVKSIAVNEKHRIHPKGQQAFTVPLFWRMTISCNPSHDSLAVLPLMDESVRNKISLLMTRVAPMPMPASTHEEKKALWEKLTSELPALVHDLLNWGVAPDHLRDPEGRFAVKAYHHPEALALSESISVTGEILAALMERLDEKDASGRRLTATLTASQILEKWGHDSAFTHQSPRSLGRHLKNLSEIQPKRVRLVKADSSNGNKYEIRHPDLDLID